MKLPVSDSVNNNPLGDADYASVQRIKQIVHDTVPLCDKAERCGINVAGQRATLDAMAAFAAAVEREFFPTGRPK